MQQRGRDLAFHPFPEGEVSHGLSQERLEVQEGGPHALLALVDGVCLSKLLDVHRRAGNHGKNIL